MITARYGDVGDIVPVHVKLVDLDLAGGTAAAPVAPAPAPVQLHQNQLRCQLHQNQLQRLPFLQSDKACPTRANNLLARCWYLLPFETMPWSRELRLRSRIWTGRKNHSRRLTMLTAVALARHTSTGKPTGTKALPGIRLPPRQQIEIKIVGLRRVLRRWWNRCSVHHTSLMSTKWTPRAGGDSQQAQAAGAEYGVKLTYIPFIMKALVSVFKEFPTVNAVMNEERFSLNVKGSVNIGIATDTPQGLYVPVIHNVEQKSILQLAAEIADLTNRTREGKAGLNELQGGTFTITSVGNIGGRFATPIINHPEVAILGVNQIHDRPMVINGEVVARKMMYLSPSFDHRVIDGAVAARFVSALKKVLENPAGLLLELR